MVLGRQNSITKYLELRSMDASKLINNKVLFDPSLNTELISRGKTTEAKYITYQMSNTADGRESENSFVREDTIGLNENLVGIQTNSNQ